MSDSVSKIAAALLASQREIEGVSKNADNPHFKHRFADLTAVIEATIPVLNKHGIAVIQLPTQPVHEGELALTTMLLHESGESISGTAYVPLAKNDPQAYGSAMTYARRYSLGSAVGLKFIDDDAESAMGRGGLPATKPVSPSRAEGEIKPLPAFNKFPKPQPQAEAPKRAKTPLFPKVGAKSNAEENNQ
jgi:hypothetical protein